MFYNAGQKNGESLIHVHVHEIRRPDFCAIVITYTQLYLPPFLTQFLAMHVYLLIVTDYQKVYKCALLECSIRADDTGSLHHNTD